MISVVKNMYSTSSNGNDWVCEQILTLKLMLCHCFILMCEFKSVCDNMVVLFISATSCDGRHVYATLDNYIYYYKQSYKFLSVSLTHATTVVNSPGGWYSAALREGLVYAEWQRAKSTNVPLSNHWVSLQQHLSTSTSNLHFYLFDCFIGL